MGRNFVRKIFTVDGSWVCPAGVTSVRAVALATNNLRIAGKGNALVGLTSLGAAYAVGANSFGQLGDVSITSKSAPVEVVGGKVLRSLSARNHVVGLDGEGLAWAWGANAAGQLGDGSITLRSSPVAVAGGRHFRCVSAGEQHTAAIRMDGIAFCWGLNSLANSIPGGALGTNNVTDRSSPVAVTGSYTFKQISAGKRSTIALTTAGAAYTWGGNAGEFDASGQLGDGTTNPRSSPVAVIGGRTFVQVSMGDTHAAAIDSNGAAYCWGEGTNGQLGTGNTTYRSSPVAVIGGKVFTKIHAGQYRTLAIDTAGAVWAWGFNGGGQLGDGTITQRSSPVAVIGGRVFTDVFSGVRPSGGITTEGEAYAWGDNTDGALGTSSQTNRSSPVLVLGGRVWNTRNTEVLGSTVLTVVPGTTYPVVLFSETVRLGIETVSPSYGTPSSLVLEYFI